jgi:hypothetical protein
MKTRIYSCFLIIISLVITACGEQQPPEVAEQVAPSSAAASIPKYSAEDFFETTSFTLVGSAAHAFAPDGMSVLISSDGTGVFNAYELSLDGTPAEQLTHSEDNAVFAVSWFPSDKRILYTYDSGGNELNHVIVREEDGSSRRRVMILRLDSWAGVTMAKAFTWYPPKGILRVSISTVILPKTIVVSWYTRILDSR